MARIIQCQLVAYFGTRFRFAPLSVFLTYFFLSVYHLEIGRRGQISGAVLDLPQIWSRKYTYVLSLMERIMSV